jgi:hypothetical protein
MKEIQLHENLKSIIPREEGQTAEFKGNATLSDIYYKESKMMAWLDACAKQAQTVESSFKRFTDVVNGLEVMADKILLAAVEFLTYEDLSASFSQIISE